MIFFIFWSAAIFIFIFVNTEKKAKYGNKQNTVESIRRYSMASFVFTKHENMKIWKYEKMKKCENKIVKTSNHEIETQ